MKKGDYLVFTQHPLDGALILNGTVNNRHPTLPSLGDRRGWDIVPHEYDHVGPEVDQHANHVGAQEAAAAGHRYTAVTPKVFSRLPTVPTQRGSVRRHEWAVLHKDDPAGEWQR
jgi:hypothetical protein